MRCRAWVAARQACLLPVGHFHVVITQPAEVADIAFQNKVMVYDLLVWTALEAMLTNAADPKYLGAQIGITAVLHPWGPAMPYHPYVHMIVLGEGSAINGTRWISSRSAFPLPGRVLAALFPRLFLTRLIQLHQVGQPAFFGSTMHMAERRVFLRPVAPVRQKRWVVYSAPLFAAPQAVLTYLSSHTHHVAISNRWLNRPQRCFIDAAGRKVGGVFGCQLPTKFSPLERRLSISDRISC